MATLLSRIKLQGELNKYQKKQLGKFVSQRYLALYGQPPGYVELNLTAQDGTPIVRRVADYPDEFLAEMDKMITAYFKRIQTEAPSGETLPGRPQY
jgi:hypothetical protein